MEYTVPTLTRLLQHPTTKKRKRAYTGSKKFQAAMNVWKYQVQSTEVEITDPVIHYTMTVGFLAKHDNEVYLLREYIGEDHHENSRMESPLDGLVDSVLHRELYNLFLACVILEKRYNCRLYSNAYVVQVHRKGVTRHALPAIMQSHVDALYEKERARHTSLES